MVRSFWAALAIAGLAFALDLKAPVKDERVDITKPYTLRWTHDAADPAHLSIDIVNSTVSTAVDGVLDNLAHEINKTANKLRIEWPAVIPNDTAQYRLVFIDTETGGPFENSAIFWLTIPKGESRDNTTGTGGPTGPDPGTSPYATTSATASGGLSKGDIAAIVVVLVVVAIAAAVGGLVLYRRHQRRKRQQTPTANHPDKPELDGKDLRLWRKKKHTAELATSGPEKTELEAQKDEKGFLLKRGVWELPSTPPSKPAELAGHDVPAIEMPSNGQDEISAADDRTQTSHTSTTLAEGFNIPRKPVATVPNQGDTRQPDEVSSIRSAPRPKSSKPASTIGAGESRFVEALRDLTSTTRQPSRCQRSWPSLVPRGQQGGSVVNYVLNDPELSQRYKIRAITRDVNSTKARQLKERVEVVQGDVLDRSSLETALTGAHTVFAMTPPSITPDGVQVEYNSGKNIADAAVETGVEYIIFSTLPAVKEISGGKYTKVTVFDAKAQVERYIRGLQIKSAFYMPGSFMENFQAQVFLAPRPAPDGTWVMARHSSPKTQFPLIDAVGDTGKFVGAILAEPDRYEGTTFCAATALYTLEEIVAIMSKATGKTIVYKQIPLEDFRKSLSFGGDVFADMFIEGFSYGEEFGYFGPDSGKLVAWAAEHARGRLSTFEEYLQAHPLQLA